MRSAYNRIAGQSIERLAALSDGVFAIAMTLLVLDLHVPAAAAIHSETELGHTLLGLGPRFGVYAMTFMTLGIFWVGQQTQLNHLHRSARGLTWIHIAFLAAVSVTPFSTSLLAEFITYRIALLVYWINIFLLGSTLYLSWQCAVALGLTKAEVTEEVDNAVKRRIIIAQSLYAFGAVLCVFGTHWSIAFIAAVQLYYAVAPRFWGKDA